MAACGSSSCMGAGRRGIALAWAQVGHRGPFIVLVSDTTLAVDFSDGETQVVNRTTTQPVRSVKG